MGLISSLTRISPTRLSCIHPAICQLASQSRNSSLSSIHRGLRRSENVRPQGRRPATSSGRGGRDTDDEGYRLIKSERNMKHKGVSSRDSQGKISSWGIKKDKMKASLEDLRAVLRESDQRTSPHLNDRFDQEFRGGGGLSSSRPSQRLGYREGSGFSASSSRSFTGDSRSRGSRAPDSRSRGSRKPEQRSEWKPRGEGDRTRSAPPRSWSASTREGGDHSASDRRSEWKPRGEGDRTRSEPPRSWNASNREGGDHSASDRRSEWKPRGEGDRPRSAPPRTWNDSSRDGGDNSRPDRRPEWRSRDGGDRARSEPFHAQNTFDRAGGDRSTQGRRPEWNSDGGGKITPRSQAGRPPTTWDRDGSAPEQRSGWKGRSEGGGSTRPGPPARYGDKPGGRPQASDGFMPSFRDRSYDAPISIPHTTAASQFLYGYSVVEEALRAGKRKFYKLYIYRGDNRGEAKVGDEQKIVALAEGAKVQIQSMKSDDQRLMSKMAQGRPHNGFILEASPLPQLPIKCIRTLYTKKGVQMYKVRTHPQSAEEAEINGTNDEFIYQSHNGRKPLLVLVDGVKDEGNLGGIIRSASFLGVDAVVISMRATAKLSSVALKASAGAAESMRLFTTPDPAWFVEGSRERGWKVFASVPPSSKDLNKPSMDVHKFERSGEDPLVKNPCILVLGGEGDGLAAAVRRHADMELFVPDELSKNSAVESLNVSVAAGLLMSAFVKPKISDDPFEKMF